MSRGTSRLVVFHALLVSRLVVFHVSCYSMSHENEDFHGNFLNFTRKYLRVTMRGPPRVSEVTLELYCRLPTVMHYPKIFSSQHITKTITTEAILLTVILHRISLLLCIYYRIDYVMNLNGFTRGKHMNVWLSKLFTVKI